MFFFYFFFLAISFNSNEDRNGEEGKGKDEGEWFSFFLLFFRNIIFIKITIGKAVDKKEGEERRRRSEDDYSFLS